MTGAEKAIVVARRSPSLLGQNLTERLWGGAVVGLLLLVVVVAIVVYPAFDTTNNIENLLRQSVPPALVALGMTLVLISGEFDVSVGATYAGAGLLFAGLSGEMPMGIALLVSLGAGAGVGIFNAILITVFKLPSFMATFGSALVVTAAALYYSNAAILVTSSSALSLGHPKIFGLPGDVIGAAVLFAVMGVLLARTAYGRSLIAVGGNREAARLAGIRVGYVKASTFVLTGATAALAGIIIVSKSSSASPSSGGGANLEIPLSAIAAVVIGGTSIWGGRGAVWRTAVGVLILAVLGNVFDGLSVAAGAQLIVEGIAVVVAIAFQRRTDEVGS